MSIAFDRCCFIVLFAIPLDVDLSATMGVGSVYLCPSSSSFVRIFSPSLKFMNSPPNSASAAEDMTFLKMPAIDSMAPLCMFGCRDCFL